MRPVVTARFTGHKGPVYALVQGDVPRTLLSGSGDGHVVRWSFDRPEEGFAVVHVGRPVFALHLHRPLGLLFIGTDSGSLHVVDLRSGREQQLFQHQRKGLYAIAALPGGRIACAGGDGSLAVYAPAPTVHRERLIPLIEGKLRGLAVSPDGRLMAVAGGDGHVRLLETTDLNEVHTLEAHEGGALCAAWHPTKPALVTGGKDGHLRVWRTDGEVREVLALPAHKAAVYGLAFHPGAGLLASAGRDKMAKLWDAGAMAPVARLDRPAGGHQHSVNTLLWCGDTLVTAGDDRTLVAWEVPVT